MTRTITATAGSQTIYVYPNEGYEVDKVLINGKEVDGSSGSYTVENIQGDVKINVTFKPVGSFGMSCACVHCGFWSAIFPGLGCICPWCWLIPLALILSAVAFILWRARRKHIQKTKVAR